jgi:hypothetical protein
MVENLYSIFAVDPGGSTGLAWATFHKEAQTVKEAIETKLAPGQLTIEDSDRNQVTMICRRWRTLYKTWVMGMGIPPHDCYMVIESFVLGPKTPSGKAPLRAVNIGQGVYYYRLGSAHEHERWNCGEVPPVFVYWQTPAQASSFARAERLKDWGVWVRGHQHERSAWKHVALRVALIQQSSRASRVRATARALA